MSKLKTFMALTMATMALASCTQNASNEATEQTAEPALADTLSKVKPQELKNAIELISDDWMLLAAGTKEDFNEMTISWGAMGELWGKDVITVFVDTTRYTYQYMVREDYFTVTGFPKKYHEDLQYLGTHSGRDGNKLAETNLHAAFTELGTPYFEEASVVIECKKIYANNFDTSKMTNGFEDFYAKRGSVHAVFIGEIVNTWKK